MSKCVAEAKAKLTDGFSCCSSDPSGGPIRNNAAGCSVGRNIDRSNGCR